MRTNARQLIERGPDVSVGVVSADLLRLGEELETLAAAGVSTLHIDVMDGVFCPQMTVGPPFIKALPDHFVRDVHLMIEEPVEKLDAFVEAGADIITVHVESTRHVHRVLQRLDGSGVLRGLALSPGTPVASIGPVIDDVDLVLLLSVNPGWGGQHHLASTPQRVAELRQCIGGRDVVLAVDGGINLGNAGEVAGLGVDLVVSGTAVFADGDTAAGVTAMLAAVRSASRR